MNNLKITFAILIPLLIYACGDNKPAADTRTDTISHKAVADQANTSNKTILFFGDSLTAGYGLDDPSQAFPGVIKARIDSLKLPYNVVNAGVSGETSAGGLGWIDWILKQKIDVFILELGANDGLRGTPIPETISNLQSIIDKVKTRYPKAKIILAGMMVPPSMGNTYCIAFKNIFPGLAAKNHIQLIPFLLDGVAGDRKLNQADGIHPTATGAKLVADNVWHVLKNEL